MCGEIHLRSIAYKQIRAPLPPKPLFSRPRQELQFRVGRYQPLMPLVTEFRWLTQRIEDQRCLVTARKQRITILRFARIMFRRLGDEGAADVAGSRGSRFIVESFATIPRKTNRLSSNFVTPARLLPGVSCCTRGSRRVKIWKPRHCLGRCCSVTWTRWEGRGIVAYLPICT